MPLAAGQTLSFYEIVGPLGAGGMGEVWRARDTRLGREVAIKVLPDAFLSDEERLRRFEREAKTLASLNHPNVAQIYGIDQVGDTCFLALELVPGEDLSRRLARGPLAPEDALDVCRQIAEGLAAAHDAGVVHRDLKPGNVCLTPEGTVKLLDFGLAKGGDVAGARPGSGSAARPDSFVLTEEGLVLGTPTYMSPEQARGKPVDRRSDVWAFGCVLYECLTGERAFGGATVADVLAAVVGHEPDLEALRRAAPPRVVELVRRTLVKDPRQRLQHLGDARIALERALREPGADEPTPRRRSSAAPLLAALGGLALGAATVWLALGGALGTGAGSERAEPAPVARVAVAIPRSEWGLMPRVAPGGGAIVYCTEEDDGAGRPRNVLFLRPLDAPEALRLSGTENARTLAFSPDGSALAVVVARPREPLRVVRIGLDGGAPRVVPLGSFAPDCYTSSGVAWLEGDLLVASGNRRRLLVRPVEGSVWKEVPITAPGSPLVYSPEVYRGLPGGRQVLALSYGYGPEGYEASVLAIDVATGAAKALVDGGHGAWVPTGELLFTRGDTLYAVPFDLDALATIGAPRPLFGGLRTSEPWEPAWFDVARDGTLVHGPGGRQGDRRTLSLVSADGRAEPWSSDRRAFDGMMRVAADGSFLAAAVATSNGLLELWGSAIDEPLLRPLCSAPATDFIPGPIDHERGVLYFSRLSDDGLAGLWRTPLDAPERAEHLLASTRGAILIALELAPDGRELIARSEDDAGVRLVALPVDGARGGTRDLFAIDAETWDPRLSPDGRWLSYRSTQDGRRPLSLRRWRTDGSLGPAIPLPEGAVGESDWAIWSRSGSAEHPTLLVSPSKDGRILEIDVLGDDVPRFSAPRLRASFDKDLLMLFESLPDGRLLVLQREESEGAVDRIDVVLGTESLLGG